jgi:hypothetical protein
MPRCVTRHAGQARTTKAPVDIALNGTRGGVQGKSDITATPDKSFKYKHLYLLKFLSSSQFV